MTRLTTLQYHAEHAHTDHQRNTARAMLDEVQGDTYPADVMWAAPGAIEPPAWTPWDGLDNLPPSRLSQALEAWAWWAVIAAAVMAVIGVAAHFVLAGWV